MQRSVSSRNVNKKVEVATGVFLQGRELEDFCQQRGRCPLCATTKVKKRVIRVFGTKKWEPITVLRTTVDESPSGRQKKKNNLFPPKKGGSCNGDKETVEEYLVYKGFCLREGCFTLNQAKRLANCDTSGIGAGGGGGGGGRVSTSVWRTNPASTRTFNDALNKLNSSKPKSDGRSVIFSRSASMGSSISVATSAGSDKDSDRSKSTFPPLQVRLQFLGENPCGPAIQFIKKLVYTDEDSYECDLSTSEEIAEPIRHIIDQTCQTLQGKYLPTGSSMIRTIDLTGIQLSISEMTTLAEGLQTSMSHGVIHLSSLILKNCGIDNDRLGILGTALYDGLRTSTKPKVGNRSTTNAPIEKYEYTHVMRLKRLNLGENNIGTYGLDGLCRYLESSTCRLEVLDLSRNHIETMGGVIIFNAFRRNNQSRIRLIDLSYNLLRKLDADDENNPNLSNDELDDNDDIEPYHRKSFFGPSFGIHGFLAKNRTIQELNLSGNRMRNRGVEALCGGLCIAGRQSSLSILRLGYNRIGDSGARALGTCLTINKSLTLIELNDNGIHNDGGMALLSAMGRNTTVEEITGLWSNNIDRRYIIVSIRRLLLSMERGKSETDMLDDDCDKVETEESDDEGDGLDKECEYRFGTTAIEISNKDGRDTKTGEECQEKHIAPHQEKTIVDPQEIVSDLSEEDKDDENEHVEHGISLCDTVQTEDRNDCELATDGMMETNQEMSQNVFDRMSVLYSAPLVFYEKKIGVHKAIPLYDAGREVETIREAVAVAITRGSKIEVREETATLDSFKAFFSRGDSTVLHFFCHGLEDAIMLENGHGYLMKISLENLEELVSTAGSTLQVVFVSSHHALTVGQAFIDAGVPHVVCCHREVGFRDPIATEFAKCFYRNAAQQKTLIESFENAVQEVLSSQLSENLRQVAKRFHLLQSSSESSTSIFFQKVAPTASNDGVNQERIWKMPPLSDHFLGRELDMFKIIEAIEVNDCVNIYGTPGHGKDCLVSTVIDYAVRRRETFSIDHSYWIPAPELVTIEPDSVYEDLNICCDVIRTSSEDLWDTGNEKLLDCRERLEIELEEASLFVVIDSRRFSSKESQASMHKLAKFILATARVAKIIYISTARDNGAFCSRNFEINTLDLRSTALLFGETSSQISSNKCFLARSADEFAELVDQSFFSHAESLLTDVSQRRIDIFHRMGNGFPSEVIAIAQTMSLTEFNALIEVICKPEINVDCMRRLESEIGRWTTFRDLAVKEKNYQRATDLHALLDDLEKMRYKFPSLKDLKDKEYLMKSDLANAVSNRHYDVANELKKDLLDLKKAIMKERRVSTNDTPNEMMNGIKARVDSIVADTVNDSVEFDESQILKGTISFEVDCDGRVCKFLFYSGSMFDLNNSNSEEADKRSKGIVCWSNESCILNDSLNGKPVLTIDSDEFNKHIEKLPILKETQYGPIVCGNGNSLMLNNKADEFPSEIRLSDSISSPSASRKSQEVTILTVGPFLTSSGQIDTMLERDSHFLYFSKVTARSCYRSCITQANQAHLQILAISLLTACSANCLVYKEMLRIGLRTLTEETKFSVLQEVHVVGKDPHETAELVEMMQILGYTSTQE